MLAFAFHALCRDGPQPFRPIDFAPARANDFTGTTSGQNQKFQSCRRDTFLLPKVDHKAAYLGIRQCRMMLDFLCLLGKPSDKWSAPCRIVAFSTPTARYSKVDDSLNS